MSASENRAMVPIGVKKNSMDWQKRKNSWESFVNSHGLKNNSQVTNLAVTYSDLS
jgi:hypothetical protein